MKRTIYCLLFLSLALTARAQMISGTDTLYGNEWINYEQTYYKLQVAEDGLCRIPAEVLLAAGMEVATIPGNRYQLYRLGEQVPLYVSSGAQALGENDYLEFFGRRNRAELDRHLLADSTEVFNEEYSIISDTAAYFLTIGPEPGLRYAEEESTAPANTAPLTHAWVTETQVWSERYDKPKTGGVLFSRFQGWEGWGSIYRRNKAYVLPVAGRLYAEAPARLSLKIKGDGIENELQIFLKDNNNLAVEEPLNNYAIKTYQFEIPVTDLGSSYRVRLYGPNAAQERFSVPWLKLRYPLQPTALEQGRVYELDATQSGLLPLDAWATTESNAVYDLANDRRLTAKEGAFYFSQGGAAFCLAVPADTIEVLNVTRFQDLSRQKGKYLMLSHPYFMGAGGAENVVQTYAEYRNSAAGGNYQTGIINIEDIYEQFGYGQSRHFIALRNYFSFLKKEKQAPGFIYIIGKGLEYSSSRTADQLSDASGQQLFFVPTFGRPGSDNLLVAADNTVPDIPIGRLAATSLQEVTDYLGKVKAHEGLALRPFVPEERDWTKQVVHLSSGDPSIWDYIYSLMNNLKTIVGQGKTGYNVTTFRKTSTDVIQESSSDGIYDRMNEGAAMLTFFGHGSVDVFDFSIDNMERYQNKDKYFFLLALGCSTGNIHTRGGSQAEKFVLPKEKGAISFMSTSNSSYVSHLYNTTRQFYTEMAGMNYGRPIAYNLMKAYENQPSSLYNIIHLYNYHGDPATFLHSAAGPDYEINRSSVQIGNGVITAQQDSFQVQFTVRNNGAYQIDTIAVQFAQQLPNGDTVQLGQYMLPAPAYEQPVDIQLPVLKREGLAGINRLLITVDPQDAAAETAGVQAENNNELKDESGTPGLPFLIQSNQVQPLYPANYAIVQDQPVLHAFSTNVLAPTTTYTFELDTTQEFRQPLLSARQTAGGGLLGWQPDFAFAKEQVYYWRVYSAPEEKESSVVFSFVYQPDWEEGWNQSHWEQFRENKLDDVSLTTDAGFQFTAKSQDLRIVNRIRAYLGLPSTYLNSERIVELFHAKLAESLNFIVIDEFGYLKMNNYPGDFGSNSEEYPYPVGQFAFPLDMPEKRKAIIDFLQNEVKTGQTVIVFTHQRTDRTGLYTKEWAADSLLYDGQNLFNVLEKEGASAIRQLEEEARPYVFAFRKGKGAIREDIAPTILDEIDFQLSFSKTVHSGSLQSTLIGPSRNWQAAIREDLVLAAEEEADFQLWGFDANQQNKTLLMDKLDPAVDLRAIDAATFPYVQLSVSLQDSLRFTPPAPDFWRVHYTTVGDAALLSDGLSVFADSLQYGTPLQLACQLQNPTTETLLDIPVRYTLLDQNNRSFTKTITLDSLAGNSSMSIEETFASLELTAGPASLLIEVNPERDPLELSYDNNTLLHTFTLLADTEAPLLDVTFDGQRILDGDLVSGRPLIRISLREENTLLELVDSAAIQADLQFPDGSTLALNKQTNGLQLIKEQSSDGITLALEYQAELLQNGIYRLQVNAQDASGNRSGSQPLELRFEVDNEQRISNLLNYPNPFSTQTQFVYTLTGNTSPAEYYLQIYTVSGRLVRTVSREELGDLQIGTHRTRFAFDGKDDYGDQLANGVYLYRFYFRNADGSTVETRENRAIDGFFDKGWGKMVLLR